MPRLWIQDKVTSILQSHEQFIERDQIIDAVDDAIRQHGRNNPAIGIADVVSDGLKRQALPASYVARSSELVDLEYPVGQVPRVLMSRANYGVQDDIVLGQPAKVMAFVSPPKNGETYRVRNTTPVTITGGRYGISEITVAASAVVRTTRPHRLTTGVSVTLSGTDSVPSLDGDHVVTVVDQHRFSVAVTTTTAGTTGTAEYEGASNVATHEESALAHLSAHYGFLVIAARFAHSNRPDIEADAINYDQKPSEFRRLAEEERVKYVDIMVGETDLDFGSTAFASEAQGVDAMPAESRIAPDRHRTATVGGL